MSDINLNLNPQLTARLKAVQEYWGHDAISETVALILDAIVNKWDIPLPNTPQFIADKSSRLRLKVRHVAYFEQMSEFSGIATNELGIEPGCV